jgi:hypothetical protein
MGAIVVQEFSIDHACGTIKIDREKETARAMIKD